MGVTVGARVGVSVGVFVGVWVGVSVKVGVKDGVGEAGIGVARFGFWQARIKINITVRRKVVF